MNKLLLTSLFLMSFSVSLLASPANGKVYADVNGLVCDFCARALEKVFGKRDEVESIDVDLDEKVITIHFNQGKALDDETITNLIQASGYNVRGIRHEK